MPGSQNSNALQQSRQSENPEGGYFCGNLREAWRSLNWNFLAGRFEYSEAEYRSEAAQPQYDSGQNGKYFFRG